MIKIKIKFQNNFENKCTKKQIKMLIVGISRWSDLLIFLYFSGLWNYSSVSLDYYYKQIRTTEEKNEETQQLWLKIAYYYEQIMTLKNNFRK